jgi:threonine dehydrogenase-like Zn-dependent dehydrogenase
MLFWGHTAETPPKSRITIGHENTGEVVALGKSVTGFSVGDKVGCLGCSYACCKSKVSATMSGGETMLTRYTPGQTSVKAAKPTICYARRELEDCMASQRTVTLPSTRYRTIEMRWCSLRRWT